MKRPVDSLIAEDFAKSPVWRFTNSDSPEETHVTPVRRLPVERLAVSWAAIFVSRMEQC